MNGRRVIVSAVLAALAAWIWVACHPSPEKMIRKQLDGLARAASFGPNQGTIAKLAGAEGLADFFSTNVEIKIDLPRHQEHRQMSRAEIPQAAMAARSQVQSLSVAFPDVTIIVNADQETAVADATLRVNVAGEPNLIVQEVKISFRKINGEWLILKVETVRTLE